MLLGCIGDDFTGSSDLGNTLTKSGFHTVQYVGVPGEPAAPGVEAGIVALKSRTIPVRDAVEQSLAALEWLRAQGCTQFMFKYCSTFDSTPEGNIGPVSEALAQALGARKVIMCPAFPAAGRSICQGHLFVGDRLLNESGMQNHPLTPMVDADLRRWLSSQIDGTVGHLPIEVVLQGPAAIRDRLTAEDEAGHRLIVADAIRDDDLFALGKAVRDLPLLTGGSGIAMGLFDNFAEHIDRSGQGAAWRGQGGRAAILSGSCSTATQNQVALHRRDNPALEITAADVMAGRMTGQTIADWAMAQPGLPIAYSTADAQAVASAQTAYGKDAVAHRMEQVFAEAAKALVAAGVTRLITAGGETSGAVVEALAPGSLAIGPEIDPGVPMVRASETLVLALKSGNFGAPDFFAKAAAMMDTQP
ncbi:3-oxo-tetronate kinase [Oceaniglobus trochenteri]|uniref:3-oxo-tetronate kinase n=1 Tax=Oceaniglobus trochenteri TaxID=2763260 RepID=UPI001CFFCC21|nr:3-oxo-tetronate kinase [Oceaniglobus trochenteri]